MNTIEFNNVWKKFRRGEKTNSLRDSIPYFFKSALNKNPVGDFLAVSEFWAVKDVSFQIKRGEVVGFIGPNGAGKSTILKLLSRIIVPNKGDMKVNGRLSALIDVTAGFHSELTGRENIYLNGTILGMKKREIDRKLDQIVDFSGIGEFIDTPVKRYSSGMFSRLGFSVAAHVDPDILLVDEVLAVGDIAFQSQCTRKMRELLNSGVTIILVSHQLPLVQSFCQRVILLDHGEIKQEGLADDVIPQYENFVFQHMENELKYRIHVGGEAVVTKDAAIMEVSRVRYFNEQGHEKMDFSVGEDIHLQLDYRSREEVVDPVVAVDIIRADGIVCSSSNTKECGLQLGSVIGPGSLRVHLKGMRLAPGLYHTRFTVWDELMLQPFSIRKEDVFRIAADKNLKHTDAVFISAFQWQVAIRSPYGHEQQH